MTPTSTPTAVPPVAGPRPSASDSTTVPVAGPRGPQGPQVGLASTGTDGTSMAVTASVAMLVLLGGAALLMLAQRRGREKHLKG
ncbi:hypothetical protein [Rathayibacter oskolensis]|uniref:hypothetical protein n=1 Tax=Rathayibacter oskolensis TaxID=1891671 RepID=UPI001AD7F8C8|nr:hypothetical protein [Rathayibacter oskolensis]